MANCALRSQKVVKIVKRLLSDEHPPSIGIACFNLSQCDVIVEALDLSPLRTQSSLEDWRQRARKGQSSFEGLFARNLENVQGDERDHMIISATYGPDHTANSTAV